MTSRYNGKPLLRFLECYVLDSIGELTPGDRSHLKRMGPKLKSLYKMDGDWRCIVSQIMNFPPTLNDNLRSLWLRNRDLAAQHGEELLAEDFARMIVDENLAKG